MSSATLAEPFGEWNSRAAFRIEPPARMRASFLLDLPTRTDRSPYSSELSHLSFFFRMP